jgi:hypothetical protein
MLVACVNPDELDATTWTVDVSACVCGWLPHAVRVEQIEASRNRSVSTEVTGARRLRRSKVAKYSPGSQNNIPHAAAPRDGKRCGIATLAEAPVWMVTVVLPVSAKLLSEREAGWKLQVDWAGSPIQENWRVPVNPGAPLNLILSETLAPRDRVRDVWSAAEVRTATALEEDEVKLASPPYWAVKLVLEDGTAESV